MAVLAVSPLYCSITVMVALPPASTRMVPFWSTDATRGLLLFHMSFFLLVFPGVTVAFAVVVLPTDRFFSSFVLVMRSDVARTSLTVIVTAVCFLLFFSVRVMTAVPAFLP